MVLEMEATRIPNRAAGNIIDGDADEESPQNMVLLTGAMGFIGSLLLRELLLHRESLFIPGGVVVIVRSKRGKSAQDRIDRLLCQTMFNFLTEPQKRSSVHVLEGDVTLPDCGMRKDRLEELCGKTMRVSNVFHCAGAVSFLQTLEDAAVSNITSPLQLQRMTCKLDRGSINNRSELRGNHNRNSAATKFAYVSTAFVQGGNTGTPSSPLPDTKLFLLGPYDPWELYKSMLGLQSHASSAMVELKFPNTYAFSKCVCEHLLLLQQQASSSSAGEVTSSNSTSERDVETIIVRPSIVGPSVQQPHEGWVGEKPYTSSLPVAAACLYLKFPFTSW